MIKIAMFNRTFAFLPMALALLLIGSGCAFAPPQKDHIVEPGDLVIQEPIDLKPAIDLNHSQARRDLDILIYALENGYGGRKYVPQENFKILLGELRSLRGNALSTQSLCDSIGELFFRYVPDNHLVIKSNGKWCGGRVYEKGQVGNNLWAKRDPPWNIQYRNGIPIISITTMPDVSDAAWIGFSESIQKTIKKRPKAVVIDLRGNGGGSDQKGKEMATYFFGQNPPRLIDKIMRSQTPATYALQLNAAKLHVFYDLEDKKTVPQYKIDRVKKYQDLLDQAKLGVLQPEIEVNPESGPTYYSQKGFNKPIFILVDRACASSCEDILEAFSGHPHAKRIGQNSAGYVQFGNMGNVLLPNSHLLVQVATDFWHFRDGVWREFKGYDPDIRLKNGQDALQEAINLLSQ